MADNEKKVELTEEELEAVAGGVIPPEVWKTMTPEERQAAELDSDRKREAGQYCQMD